MTAPAPTAAPAAATPGAAATGPATLDAATLDALADPTLVLDADGVVTAANAAALRLLGYRRDELCGRDCVAALDARDDDGGALRAAGWHPSSRLRSVRSVPEQRVALRRRDGREVVVALTAAYRRDAHGAVAGAVVSLRDTAHRTRVGAVTGIGIVSTVSHELRSPLTSVKGYTSLLLHRWDRLADEQKLMMIGQVNHDADRVTRLIGELLDISRLETGRLVLRRQLVDLPVLAASVVDKVRLEYPDLDATLDWPAGYPRVLADPDKLEQVLTNLVENACKYASPVGLRIDGTVVAPTPEAPRGAVTVAVADRGEGIAADDLPHVFTRFFRRSEGRPTGSGLGLWISRGLVESHGGRLEATANPGDGSVFRFTLPLTDLEDLSAP